MKPSEALSRRDEAWLREKYPCETDYQTALGRLDAGEPLAYVLGEWCFYGETYTVSPDCLIPQPDTEHVVEAVIRKLPAGGRFADLCTGSGCIAVSALAYRMDAEAVAADISRQALRLAAINAARNGVAERLRLRQADLLAEDPFDPGEQWDLIVSNPPYIRSDVIPTLDPQVRQEPRLALDGGADGLTFYRTLLTRYTAHIKPGGFLIMEIGYDQKEAVETLCRTLLTKPYRMTVKKDYGGNDRVVILAFLAE